MACFTRNEGTPSSRRYLPHLHPQAMEAPGFSAVLKQGRSGALVPRERTVGRRALRVRWGSPPRVPTARQRRSGRAFPGPSPRRRSLPVSRALPSVGRSCRAPPPSPRASGAGSRAPAFGPASLGQHVQHLVPGGLPGQDDPVGRGHRRGGGREPGKARRGPRSLSGARERTAGRTAGAGPGRAGLARCGAGEGAARVGRGVGARGVRRARAEISRKEQVALTGRGAELEADAEAGRVADR